MQDAESATVETPGPLALPLPGSAARPESPPAVAPRPHWIAIATGLAGPLVACLALIFSFVGFRISSQSLNVSQEALATSQTGLEIGQTAYVALTDGTMKIESYGARSDHQLVSLKLAFKIANVGNTPADLKRLTLEPELPAGWSVSALAANKSFIWGDDTGKHIGDKLAIGYIGQHSSTELHEFQYALHAPKDAPLPRMRLIGHLRYTNVFGHERVTKWCWQAGPDLHFSDCTSAWAFELSQKR
jgi:hypothetical protein